MELIVSTQPFCRWAIVSASLLVALVFYRRSKETKSAWEKHRKEVHPPRRKMRLVL